LFGVSATAPIGASLSQSWLAHITKTTRWWDAWHQYVSVCLLVPCLVLCTSTVFSKVKDASRTIPWDCPKHWRCILLPYFDRMWGRQTAASNCSVSSSQTVPPWMPSSSGENPFKKIDFL
jgi:hypothetical protein